MVLSGFAGFGIWRFFSSRSNTAAVSSVLLATGLYFTPSSHCSPSSGLYDCCVSETRPMIGVKDSL